MSDTVHTVSILTAYIKRTLEHDPILKRVHVEGEISNMTEHRSGHVYFSLKDQHAQINCAMWRSSAERYKGRLPKHGEKIIAVGEISVYAPRGNYQLIVRELRRSGLGDLHMKFLETRNKLKEEGLFDPLRKKPLPAFPRKIGVITSPTGAVIRDILDTIRRRYPHVNVVLVPTPVQGPGSAPKIVHSLERLNAYGQVDVILLARGGGSLEDLWCFNEESVARAIATSEIPVISGVGHETDTTIADYVADQRASTPTAAAELAVPVARDVINYLNQSERDLSRQLQNFIAYRQQMLDDYSERFRSRLTGFIEQKRGELERIQDRMEGVIFGQIQVRRMRLEEYQTRLTGEIQGQFRLKKLQLEELWSRMGLEVRRHFDRARFDLDKMELEFRSLDMRQVLQRGYSVTLRAGKMVRNASELRPGETIETVFGEGRARSTVDEVVGEL